MPSLTPIVQAFLDDLNQMFPEKHVYSYDEYAKYIGISRKHAPEHLRNLHAEHQGQIYLAHIPLGRRILIRPEDFAYFLAELRIVNGKRKKLPNLRFDGKMKRTRGYILD